MGATYALKGYRTQFLYSLNKILYEYKNDYIFQPEGKFEDLDILDINHNYIEIIQIKNKTTSLTYSDLKSKSSSFFKRARSAINHSPNTIIKLISFSPISNDLINHQKLAQKLKKSGFNDTDIKKIIDNYKYEIVDEKELESQILSTLKGLSVFTNPKVALELLLYWLFIAGEKQEKINSKELISKLERIGKFTTEQTSFNNQFYNSIIPFSIKTITEEDIEIYKEGFYYGVSAKFEHILADLDVLRNDKLEAIKQDFINNNIVFIHGASGQGKSTLAYRYLHDFSSNQTSYELKISQNLSEVYETINALDALSKGLAFPITLYLDIKPQDIYWNEILKELYGRRNLRFLITIRQEDWNKLALGIDYRFSEIDLTFDKKEASIIYENLSLFKEDLNFIDFEESWSKFKKGGMLLEYVYLITQGDTLKTRLEQQIKKIEERVLINNTDELEILRYVCLADSLNSKINYKRLASSLNIKAPKLYIDYFEKEYLLQYSNNKEYLTGLHPIRSKMLCEILFHENNFLDISDYTINSLHLIDEEDLYIYLLESFLSGLKIKSCIEKLRAIKFNSWTGYSGTITALIWKGMYDFIFINNINPIKELYSEFKENWSYNVPFDFANDERANGVFVILQQYYNEEKIQKINEINKQFKSKNTIYNYVKEFLKNKSILDTNVLTSLDVKSLGEVNFWISELKLNIKTIINEDQLLEKLDIALSLKDYSILLFGLQLNDYNPLYVQRIKKLFIEKLRKENNILFLEETERIDCKYFFDPIDFDDQNNSKGNFMNNASMKIIDLLRFAFPNKEIYSIKGIEYAFFGIEIAHDPSHKEIPISNLPNPYLVANNALIGNLFNYQFKPDNWGDYVFIVNQNREKYSELVLSLIYKFEEYFKSHDIVKFVTYISELKLQLQEIKPTPFPKNISDKWGYISDGTDLEQLNNNNIIITESVLSLKKYSKFKEYSNNFFSSLNSFLNTLDSHIISIIQIKLSQKNKEDYNPNLAFYNIKKALSNCNLYHAEFVKLFSKFCDNEKLNQLSVKENKNLEILFNCWHQFNYKNEKLNNKVLKQTNQNFLMTKNDLIKRFSNERKEIAKEKGFLFNIYLTDKTENTLILTCEVSSDDYLYSIIVARELLQRTIKASYTSVKSVYIENNIKTAIYIPFFNGKPINRGALQLTLYNLDKEIDECEFWVDPFYKLNDKLKNSIELDFWNEKIPNIGNYEKILGELTSLKELKYQILNIKNHMVKFDNLGQTIIKNYEEKVDSYLKSKIFESKDLWISLKNNFNDDLIHSQVLILINKFLNNELLEIKELEDVCGKINSNYQPYAESLIYKNGYVNKK